MLLKIQHGGILPSGKYKKKHDIAKIFGPISAEHLCDDA